MCIYVCQTKQVLRHCTHAHNCQQPIPELRRGRASATDDDNDDADADADADDAGWHGRLANMIALTVRARARARMSDA